jgi:hypothetical protein
VPYECRLSGCNQVFPFYRHEFLILPGFEFSRMPDPCEADPFHPGQSGGPDEPGNRRRQILQAGIRNWSLVGFPGFPDHLFGHFPEFPVKEIIHCLEEANKRHHQKSEDDENFFHIISLNLYIAKLNRNAVH